MIAYSWTPKEGTNQLWITSLPVIWTRATAKVATVKLPKDRYVAENSELRWSRDGGRLLLALRSLTWKERVTHRFAEMTGGPVFVQSSQDPFLAWDELRAKCPSDFITPPRWEQKSNWNAAVLLTLIAGRMIAMDHDVELAGTIARSARVVADLDKPIERIAEAASLSIVESLDEASVDILSEWLESGRATFAERVNREWRLRRDAGLSRRGR